MDKVVIRGKRAGHISLADRKNLMRPENWDTFVKSRMPGYGLIGDRYVYGLAPFEPELVGLKGNCGDIIRWKDPADPERKLRQYMILLNQIKPGLFVSLHIQPLPPVDGLMYI